MLSAKWKPFCLNLNMLIPPVNICGDQKPAMDKSV